MSPFEVGQNRVKVISLTSIPPRFPHLQLTLESLLKQGADEVRISVPKTYRRFPDWDGTLPSVPEGVRIVRCESDYGPATKVLSACLDLAGTNAQILFCDDDAIFRQGWAEKLFALQSRRPEEAVAGYVRSAHDYLPNPVTPLKRPQAWQIPVHGICAIPLGAARCLAARHFRTPWRRPFALAGYGDVSSAQEASSYVQTFSTKSPFRYRQSAWAVDDIWLSAQLARKNPYRRAQRHRFRERLEQGIQRRY